MTKTKNSKNEFQRINNIVGQLNGIKTMLEDGKDCSDILIQLNAVKSAVNSLSNYIIEENFTKCLKKTKKDKELNALIKALLKNN